MLQHFKCTYTLYKALHLFSYHIEHVYQMPLFDKIHVATNSLLFGMYAENAEIY